MEQFVVENEEMIIEGQVGEDAKANAREALSGVQCDLVWDQVELVSFLCPTFRSSL